MFDIMYGEGISFTGELVDLGVEYGLVQKSGAWFSMGDIRLGQGRDAAKQYFLERPEEAEALHQRLIEAMQKAEAEEKTKGPKLSRAAKAEPEGEAEAEKPAAQAARAKSKAVSIEADDFGDEFDDDLDG